MADIKHDAVGEFAQEHELNKKVSAELQKQVPALEDSGKDFAPRLADRPTAPKAGD